MPELPEVETTRRGIATLMTSEILQEFRVHEKRLRWPVPDEINTLVRNRRVIACDRRGKYLLIHFEHGTQIIHLGMSGSLRSAPLNEPRRKHDHAEWIFAKARFLLHDPRRFGAILWHDNSHGPINTHPLLAHLGIEPFHPDFTPAYLYTHLQGRRQAIKQILLAGKIVVGVGNIYACESLFLAGIHPELPGAAISKHRAHKLHAAILQTLKAALEAGGSTLRDYVNASGGPGAYFELHAHVYEREGQACHRCLRPIKRMTQGQRSTYYCSSCQRR